MSPTPTRKGPARTAPSRAPMEFGDTTHAVVRALADMPMSTTDVISAYIGRTTGTTREHLRALSEEKAGEKYVQSAYIGSSHKRWLHPRRVSPVQPARP